MPRGQQDFLIRQFFLSMPAGAQALLYAGIFCCFAPLGLFQSAMRLQIVPWWEVATITLFSGAIAIAFTVTAIRAPRWMAVPIVLHFAAMAAMVRWLPDRPAIVSLDGPALAAVALRLQIISGLTIASLMGAFVCFFTLIRREGLRFSTAHAEIRLAREIHTALVPAVFGRTPAIEWRGVSRPSGDVGGDLVDVVSAGPAWTAIVADVTGHGVGAGVLMAMCKTAFRSAVLEGHGLADLATRMNAVLSPLSQPNMFITAACLRLGPDGCLHYVLAGHPPLLHLSLATERAAWAGESQLALGLIESAAYTEGTLSLSAGDVVIAVTDGLLEVFDRRDRELGLEGIRQAVEGAGARAALSEIEAAVFAASHRHGRQLDDQTLLVLRVTP
jgi:serine phosphatase RsbU (regulator of sigma subunit)